MEFLDPSNSPTTAADSDFSFRWVVILHLRDILKIASVEMRGGYWVTKRKFAGNIETVENYWEEDKRDVYCNAVDALFDLLYPHLHDKCVEAIEKIYNEIEEEKKKTIKETSGEENELLGGDFYDGKDKLVIEHFRVKNWRMHRQIFKYLNIELKRKKYFEMVGAVE